VTDPASQLARPLSELPDPLEIPTLSSEGGFASARVRPPGSKSLTNRALLLAGLAESESTIRGALTDADDAQRMIEALRTLGADVKVEDKTGVVRVRGVGGRWKVGAGGAGLFLNNAGTATRFLAAAALLADGPVTIDGNERMRQRPIGELTAALRALGATIEHGGDPECPPLTIHPPPLERLRGAEVRFETTKSSQFISALLLTASAMPDGLTVHLGGAVTSASYVHMTVELLQRLGVRLRTAEHLRVVRVLPGLPRFETEIEPDASGATYFWAAAAIVPSAAVTVEGLDDRALQGDARFPNVLARSGASVDPGADGIRVTGPKRLSPVMADMSDMPDAAVTLAVVAAFAEGTSVIRGVHTLRVKETDRIAALQTELGRIGVTVEANVQGDPGTMTITPPASGIALADASPVTFETYDDHRMAMALSLVGLRRPGVSIKDPACVGKTYAGFFADLARIYG